MWFKNLKIFRLSPSWQPTAEEFEHLLQGKTFVEGVFISNVNNGWTPFFEAEGTLIHKVGRHMLIKLMGEKKVVPSSLINKTLKEKIKQVEEEQGYKVGRKQTKEIKKEITFSLHSQALSTFYETRVWFDFDNHWLIIDTSSPAKSDAVIALLANAFDGVVPINSYMTALSPTSCMTSWLLDGEAPENFTIDDDSELKSMTDYRIKINYSNNLPEHEELSKQITSGKTCTKLSMTWNDRISFVLKESGSINRITPLEVLSESRSLVNSDDAIERFDAEMTLMFGELNALLNDLTEALGGENNGQSR